MADLSDRSRGQLLLVTGFVIAVAIVALVLLLNTAIYAENLTTRSTDTGANDALAYRSSVEAGLWPTVGSAADNGYNESSRSAVEANVSRRLDQFEDDISRRHHIGGAAAGVSVADYYDGARIRQPNASRRLTGAGGAANWTVVASTSDLRQFEVNTTGGLTSTSDPENDAFRLDVVGSAGNRWSLYAYEDSATSNATLAVKNGTGTIETNICSDLVDGPPRVDPVAGTVNGEPCGPLSFAEGTSPPYQLRIVYGNRSTGSYDAMVNGTLSPSIGSNYASPPNSPYDVPVVYGLRTNVTYRSDGLTYAAETATVPDPDDPAGGDALRFAEAAGESVQTSNGDVLEFQVENVRDDPVTVEAFAVNASGIGAGITVDDGNTREVDMQQTGTQTGGANRVGSFDADGTEYDFVDDSDAGGQYVIVDAGVDDAEVSIQQFSGSFGTLEVTYTPSEADLTVTLVLSDGTVEVFYFHER